MPLGNPDRPQTQANGRPRYASAQKGCLKHYEPFGNSYGLGHNSDNGHHEGPNGKNDAWVNEAGQLKKIPFEIRYPGTIEGRSSRRGKNYFFTMEVQWCARSGNGKSRAGYSKHSYRKAHRLKGGRGRDRTS